MVVNANVVKFRALLRPANRRLTQSISCFMYKLVKLMMKLVKAERARCTSNGKRHKPVHSTLRMTQTIPIVPETFSQTYWALEHVAAVVRNRWRRTESGFVRCELVESTNQKKKKRWRQSDSTRPQSTDEAFFSLSPPRRELKKDDVRRAGVVNQDTFPISLWS